MNGDHESTGWSFPSFRRFAALFLAAALVLLHGLSPTEADARKMALVIGNDAYENVADLQKAVNDSDAIAQTLAGQGFDVMRGTNLSRREMNQMVASFAGRLQQGDEAVFFFAGHGVEIEGQNFLLPSDIPNANAGAEDFVKAEAIAVARVLDSIRAPGPRVSILILDACRDNPFPRDGTRSLGGSRGFVGMNAPKGTFIMYSAGVGQTALDRLSDDDPHPNSVFTRSLVPLMKQPGLSITNLTRQLRRNVEETARSVSHEQRPAYYDEITGDFAFTPAAAEIERPQTPAPKTTPAVSASNALNEEARLAWDAVKNSKRVSDFEIFVQAYPGTFFAKLAESRIAQMKDEAKDNNVVVLNKPEPRQPQPAPVAPAAPKGPDQVTLEATIWPVGQWPEGLVSDGKTLWVAESGQRQIAQLDAAGGQVLQRVKVGRLPVDMQMMGDGTVFALVYTDGLIWEQRPDGKGRVFGRLRHYPDAMVSDENTLWVLTWPEGSSASAKVVRLERGTADAIGSGILARNGSDMVLHKGMIWVVHSFGPEGGQISLVDATTLADRGTIAVGDAVSKIDANSYGVFAAGGVWDKSGVVVKIDPASGQQAGRLEIPGQFIYAMTVTDDYLIIASYQGRIWVVDAATLELRRQIDTSFGEFQPRTLLARDDQLFITTNKGQGEEGSVVVLNGWRP